MKIHHAAMAKQRHADIGELTNVSTDTDVLLLAIAHYPDLPQYTIVRGNKYLEIKPIWEALGPLETKALLRFHSQKGTDNTGKFVGFL